MGYDEQSEMLKANIADTGKGISDEEKPKLFSQFGKLKRTADMNNEGIGMGLMIVQKLVSLSQGTISVHSDGLDKGSTFSFSMKMQKVQESTVRQRQRRRVANGRQNQAKMVQDADPGSTPAIQPLQSPASQGTQRVDTVRQEARRNEENQNAL